MNIFDILGPIMVGPSSSHTAGAARIGFIGRKLLKEEPKCATIFLHGSFATTGKGHGTDKALIAGILGMAPDDMKIPESFEIAQKKGLEYDFSNKNLKDAHPNSALIILKGTSGKTIEYQGASIGGGRIVIQKLAGIDVNFSAEKPTLIISNVDKPGLLAEVTSLLAKKNINIATIKLNRDKRGGFAVMVVELDEEMQDDSILFLEQLDGIVKVTYINQIL